MCKFVKCVETHAKHRYSVPGFTCEDWLDVPYWVCAYANRQHAGSEECAPLAGLPAERLPLRPSSLRTFTYLDMYLRVCVCVCVCVYKYYDIQIYRHVDI